MRTFLLVVPAALALACTSLGTASIVLGVMYPDSLVIATGMLSLVTGLCLLFLVSVID